ncbi:hypothetical protein BH10PLA2_BH10PLA2_03360 [soil metagenome]
MGLAPYMPLQNARGMARAITVEELDYLSDKFASCIDTVTPARLNWSHVEGFALFLRRQVCRRVRPFGGWWVEKDGWQHVDGEFGGRLALRALY